MRETLIKCHFWPFLSLSSLWKCLCRDLISASIRGNRINFICIFALFFSAALSGCHKRMIAASVVGIYVANHGLAVDILDVRADGSYIMKYDKGKGEGVMNAGKWNFEYRNGEPRIIFSGFIFGLPGYGAGRSATWDVEVEQSWGKTKLCIDPDLYYFYEKKSQ